MRTLTVDVAIVGAGTAGLRARYEAAKLGARTVLIENGPYGTTCARVGCMPSKLLIAAADAAHAAATADTFGVDVGGVRVDGARVMERVRRERDGFVDHVMESVDAIPEAERLRGTARFLAPQVLAVGDDVRVEARAVVVATGSSPWVPDALAPAGDALLTTDQLFELRALPASLAVVGTGAVGLEIGQALHRLGVRTAFFSQDERVGPSSDPALKDAVKRVLGAELDLRLSAKVSASRADDGGVVVRWKTAAGEAHEERFDRLLCAAGRRPRLAGLALERAGAALDERGNPIVDQQTMQCGTGPLFFAGDVTAHRLVLHEAADEGGAAGRNAARFPEVFAHQRRVALRIVFTDPEIAMVGTSHRELVVDDVEIGQADYARQGRARVMNQHRGLVRIYALRACGTLIGAELFGPRVEHTAHLLAWAVQARLTVSEALAMPVYHPVVEEGIRSALRDLCARLRLVSAERAVELECGPGS